MQRVFRPIELVVVIHRQVVVQFVVIDAQASLVGPAPGHVLDRVAATSENQQGQAPTLDEANTLAVPPNRRVVSTKLVASQAICATLQDYRVRTVVFSHFRHNRAENVFKLLVIDERLERHIQREVFPFSAADIHQVARAREESLAEPMEADSHDTVSRIKGFLNAITMMHINVDVEDAVVVLEQLKYGDNDVVHKAEAASLFFFGVMQAACPVDAHVGHAVIQHDRSIKTASSRYLGQIEHTRERRAIIVVAVTDVEMALLIEHLLRVLMGLLGVYVWHNALKMLDVVLAME